MHLVKIPAKRFPDFYFLLLKSQCYLLLSCIFYSGLFTPNDIYNLEEEVLKMQSFKHPNVMSLIGVCENLSGGPAVVMPFMANGSVLDYLKKNRKNLVLDAKAKENTVRVITYSISSAQ